MENIEVEQKTSNDDLIILHEDNHIIVVLKPQNIPTCGDESKDDNLLDMVKRYIKVKYNKQGNVFVGLVHRLDRPTGGVMVFAKTSKAASRLTEQLQKGDFEKKYLTVLVGTPNRTHATLTNYLKKNGVNNTVTICTQSDEGAKLASLDYTILESNDKYCLSEVNLHTGRSHQIRVQMSGINNPVYGDMKYGGERAQKGKLALWAYSLSFTHPTTNERLRFIVEPPKDENPWKMFDVEKIVKVDK